VRYVDVCADNDEAGDDCAGRIAVLGQRVQVRRVKPPTGKGRNDCLR
jgi:hypothetical protein